MKKAILVIIVFIGLVMNFSHAYSDVKEDFWAYDVITELSERNFLCGYPDGSFNPEKKMTIAEFITVFMKVVEPNIDVSNVSGHWAESSIRLAEEKNILNREDYSYFDPDSFITRREICLMIYRSLYKIQDIDLNKLENKKDFLDIDKNNDEEMAITAILSHFGVISGYPDGTAKLENNATRAEICAFIRAYLKNQHKILAVINECDFVKYENDVAIIGKNELPETLKKKTDYEDIPYITTEILEVDIFPFDSPNEKYKDVFDEINNSSHIYFKYRKKFAEGNYIIAVSFRTTNNTYDYEAYCGHEFLRLKFPEEEISIVDSFDTDEIVRQLSGNANVGEFIQPDKTHYTSAFYVVNKLPQNKIRFDRDITGLSKMNGEYDHSLRSYHSLVVNLES